MRTENTLTVSANAVVEPEWFIHANSFAAPFVSDSSSGFVRADTAEQALEKFAAEYDHPCGLYAAAVYRSADDYYKNVDPLARWLCNHELERQRLTNDLGGYSMLGHGPGDFEINGERHKVENPKQGKVIKADLSTERPHTVAGAMKEAIR